MRIASLAALTLALAGLAGCAGSPSADPPAASGACDPAALPAPNAEWKPEKARVRVNTTKGAFVAEVETERAPITAENFLALARSGFYDGTHFHRVVRDFVVQAGDPLSKDDDPTNDGEGGPGYELPDELHPALRHDAAGVLSMANSGPDSGGSQFFVTLAPTPHLDDRHSVFGRVVEGLEVVRSIGAVQVDADDRPLRPVRIETVEVLEPVPYDAERGAAAHVVIDEKRTEPRHVVRYAVILQNTGNVRDRLAVGAQPPEGWTCLLDQPLVVNPGTGRVAFLSLTPPAGASGTTTVPVYVTTSAGATASASLNVTIGDLGRLLQEGDRVSANYAGLLLDGRLFDTSIAEVANDPAQPKFDTTGGFRPRPSYEPFGFTVGGGVIPGFTDLAKSAKVGETVVGFIPARDAYATGNAYERPLTGRDLVFELEILSVA